MTGNVTQPKALVLAVSVATVLGAFVLGPTLPASAGPTGKMLITRYFSNTRQMDMILVRPSGGGWRLTKTKDASELSGVFSPDGARIAFIRERRSPRRSSLMVMATSGLGTAQRLASDPFTGVRWSPDGNWISFVRLRDDTSELVVVSPEGGEETVLASSSHIHHILDWAPDSSRIAFGMRDDTAAGEANYDIYSVRPDGTELTRLTEEPGEDLEPSFSPDSARIVFVTSREDDTDPDVGPYSSELYVMDADGSNETALTSTPDTWDEQPDWEVGGIAFQRRFDDDVKTGRGADMDIFVLDPETGEQTLLTNDDRADDSSPLWGIRGDEWIGFDRRRGSNDSEVYAVNVETGTTRQITDNRAPDDYLSDWYGR